MKLVLTSLTCAALFLSGCANMSETQQGTAKGAGIGAVAGAVIGAATGGSKGAAQGARHIGRDRGGHDAANVIGCEDAGGDLHCCVP